MQLKNINPEDIEDVLIKVEDSFGFRFSNNELAHIKTFGDLCLHVKGRIKLEDTGGCTPQQAFYKLRSALATLSVTGIATNTLLKDILPYQNRLKQVKKLEKELGFKLNVIGPPQYAVTTLAIGLLASLMLLVSSWQIAIPCVSFFVLGFIIAIKRGKELKVETVGQLAKKIALENYVNARRKPFTYNAKEIEKSLISLFTIELGLNPGQLTAETVLLYS